MRDYKLGKEAHITERPFAPLGEQESFALLKEPKILLRFLIFLMLMAAILFGLAGRWDRRMGWDKLLARVPSARMPFVWLIMARLGVRYG